jgi:hypothetical protein
MALINLQTNLKSLRYGHDRPGGGDSGQPFSYVAPNIPNIEYNYNQNLSASYAPNVGANFFDIPEVTFNAPTFGYTSGASVKSSIFKGNGVDIATPIIKGLDAAAGFVTNGAIGIANKGINFFNNTFDTTRTSNYPDFLWRTNRFAIGHAYQDMQRLTKFMVTPAGIFFVIKQELLERQNVKMEGTTRLYNPLGTIAQAGVNWIGYHLNKSGLNPLERSYAKGGNNGYYWNTKNSIGSLGVRNRPDEIGRGANRLTTLLLNKINQFSTGTSLFDQYGVTGVGNRTELIRYNGGPGAPFGIGFTRIGLTDPTRKVELRKYKTVFPYNKRDIDSPDYLTPLFFNNEPSITWYYDPFNNRDELGYRSVYSNSILKFKSKDSSFTRFQREYFGSFNDPNILLNRNTKTISSSVGLYSPATASATINRLVDNPTVPEYYIPFRIDIPYAYKPSYSGVSWEFQSILNQNYVVKDTANLEILQIPKGESRFTSDTGFFQDKTNETKNLFTLDTAEIANKTSLGKEQNTSFGSSGITDFRSGSFVNQKGEPLIVSTDYTTFNRDTTYSTSKTSFKGNVDLTTGKRVLNPNIGISSEADVTEDMIKFGFTISSPSETTSINFRAYLESWSDGFKGEWSAIKYMGRAENLYKYNGFARDSSVSFLVPTLSRLDLSTNYSKLNELINSVLPSYSSGKSGTTSGLMRGSITYVTMGDYFKAMPSIVKSVDYQEIEGMGWDIDRMQDGTRTGESLQLPKGIKVTMNFTPVHNFTPQFGETFIG